MLVITGESGTKIESVVSPPRVRLPVVVDELLPLLEGFDGGNHAEVSEDEPHDDAHGQHGHQGLAELHVGSHLGRLHGREKGGDKLCLISGHEMCCYSLQIDEPALKKKLSIGFLPSFYGLVILNGLPPPSIIVLHWEEVLKV